MTASDNDEDMALAALLHPEPHVEDGGFSQAVMERVATQPRRQPWKRSVFIVAGLAAALAAVMLVPALSHVVGQALGDVLVPVRWAQAGFGSWVVAVLLVWSLTVVVRDEGA